MSDLLERQAVKVVEQQDGPLVDRDPSECGLESRRFQAASGRIGSRQVSSIEDDLPIPTPLTERLAAGIDQDAGQPRVEAGRVSQLREIDPCRHEGFLGGVMGLGFVAQDGASRPQHSIGSRQDEKGKGITVAGPRARHESFVSVHRDGDLGQLQGCRSERRIPT